MDDTITDLTPPTSDRLVKQYDQKFHHCPVRPKEHKLSVAPRDLSFQSTCPDDALLGERRDDVREEVSFHWLR